jgi:hypothetical protein
LRRYGANVRLSRRYLLLTLTARLIIHCTVCRKV